MVSVGDVIFARSTRSTVLFAGVALGVALWLVAAAAALVVTAHVPAALVLAMLAVVAMAVVARTVRRLRRWPASRLGFFRDRLVLLHGRTELHAAWAQVQTVTLADQGDWAASRWPEVRLTERLTIRLDGARRFSFRPATCGVDPGACRDLILRLRDEPALRDKLPDFDSLLDLSSRPLHTGDLIRPQI
jgi:hypothetical protein